MTSIPSARICFALALIRRVEEKPILSNILVNIGIYVFNRQIIKYLPLKGSISKTAFPSLAKLNLIRAYTINGEWLTINTLKDIKHIESFF